MNKDNRVLEINHSLYEIYSQFGHEYVNPTKFHLSLQPINDFTEIHPACSKGGKNESSRMRGVEFKLFRNMRNGDPDFMNELVRGTATMTGIKSLQIQKSVVFEAIIRELQQNKTRTHIFPPELIQDILDLHFLEHKNAAILN